MLRFAIAAGLLWAAMLCAKLPAQDKLSFARGTSEETAQAFLNCLRSEYEVPDPEAWEGCEPCYFQVTPALESVLALAQNPEGSRPDIYEMAIRIRWAIIGDLENMLYEKDATRKALFTTRTRLNTVFLQMAEVTSVEDSLWKDKLGRERATIRIVMEGPDMQLVGDATAYWNVYRKTIWIRNLLRRDGQWMFSRDEAQVESEKGQAIVDPITGYDARRN